MSALHSARPDFQPPVRWLLARAFVALGVMAGATVMRAAVTGLVLCVWLDALAGWLARRRKWPRTGFAMECETLVDFLCFVWAPVAWLTAPGAPLMTWLSAGVFVLAGIFRLARFRVEGLVRGGYRGLPVTYNGYVIPAVGAMVATVLPQPAIVWPITLLALAVAMVSTRFVVPEL
jgi:phosphatidylserine synthase